MCKDLLRNHVQDLCRASSACFPCVLVCNALVWGKLLQNFLHNRWSAQLGYMCSVQLHLDSERPARWRRCRPVAAFSVHMHRVFFEMVAGVWLISNSACIRDKWFNNIWGQDLIWFGPRLSVITELGFPDDVYSQREVKNFKISQSDTNWCQST